MRNLKELKRSLLLFGAKESRQCLCVFFTLLALTSLAAASFPAGVVSHATTTTTTTQVTYCIVTTKIYSSWIYTDSTAHVHAFPGSSTYATARSTNPDFDCSAYDDTVNIQVWSSDGQGYYLTTAQAFGSVTITAYLRPEYLILSLLTDPPGNNSQNCFTNTTFYGVTNSTSTSFSNITTLTYTASSSIFSVVGIGGTVSSSESFGQGHSNMAAFTNTITNSAGLCNKANKNPLDHSQDVFSIWLNPMVTLTQTGSGSATYTMSPPPNQQMFAVAVTVEALQNPSSMDVNLLIPNTINGVTYPGLDSICAHPVPKCTQAPCGCTAQDFAPILAQDPLTAIAVNSTEPPSQIDSHRYQLLNPQPSPVPYLQGPSCSGCNPTSVPYSVSDQNQASYTSTNTTSYSEGFTYGVSGGVKAPPVDFTVGYTVSNVLTFTQSVGLTNFSGSSHAMSVTLGTSTFECDEAQDVYEDYVYHTFVLVPAQTPPTECDSN